MLRIGLTGGIGSGKSTVAERFAARGIPVIDSDLIARELVAPGSEALAQIVDAFGSEVLRPDGSLDRAALRRQIFFDASERRRLEAILHPRIRRQLHQRAASAPGPYGLLVIPLLIEQGWANEVDRVLVVDCSPQTQLQRTVARDRISLEEARAVLRNQATRAQRLAAADDVIVNEAAREALETQIEALDRRYRQLSQNSSA